MPDDKKDAFQPVTSGELDQLQGLVSHLHRYARKDIDAGERDEFKLDDDHEPSRRFLDHGLRYQADPPAAPIRDVVETSLAAIDAKISVLDDAKYTVAAEAKTMGALLREVFGAPAVGGAVATGERAQIHDKAKEKVDELVSSDNTEDENFRPMKPGELHFEAQSTLAKLKVLKDQVNEELKAAEKAAELDPAKKGVKDALNDKLTKLTEVEDAIKKHTKELPRKIVDKIKETPLSEKISGLGPGMNMEQMSAALVEQRLGHDAQVLKSVADGISEETEFKLGERAKSGTFRFKDPYDPFWNNRSRVEKAGVVLATLATGVLPGLAARQFYLWCFDSTNNIEMIAKDGQVSCMSIKVRPDASLAEVKHTVKNFLDAYELSFKTSKSISFSIDDKLTDKFIIEYLEEAKRRGLSVKLDEKALAKLNPARQDQVRELYKKYLATIQKDSGPGRVEFAEHEEKPTTPEYSHLAPKLGGGGPT